MKAQLSLEFLLAFVAYLTLIAVFANFEMQLGEKTKVEVASASSFLKARAICAIVDEFALSGRNTGIDFAELDNATAAGNTVFVDGASAVCNSPVRSEDGLRVAQSKREHV
ncbi:MAG: hypothetical protein V1811_01320 [Candidatus Micrarchaeota archaeon]